jgi:DNA polymerase-3 subunit delta
MVKTLPILFTYFSKVFLYHNISDKSPNNLASALSVNRMFLDDYAVAARNYPSAKLEQVFNLLHEYDLRTKGVDNASASEGDIMKEMVYRILH